MVWNLSDPNLLAARRPPSGPPPFCRRTGQSEELTNRLSVKSTFRTQKSNPRKLQWGRVIRRLWYLQPDRIEVVIDCSLTGRLSRRAKPRITTSLTKRAYEESTSIADRSTVLPIGLMFFHNASVSQDSALCGMVSTNIRFDPVDLSCDLRLADILD